MLRSTIRGNRLKLELGSVRSEITITATAPLLDDANGGRGSVIDEQSVKEYPLNSRNPFMLSMLAPGVNFDGELTYQRPFDSAAIADWSIVGSMVPGGCVGLSDADDARQQ